MFEIKRAMRLSHALVICLAANTLPIYGQSWLLTARSIRGLRKACLAVGLQAFHRVVARFRTDLDHERTLVPRVFLHFSICSQHYCVGSGPFCCINLS